MQTSDLLNREAAVLQKYSDTAVLDWLLIISLQCSRRTVATAAAERDLSDGKVHWFLWIRYTMDIVVRADDASNGQ